MINMENGFKLNCRWNFPDFRHAFAFISLFVLILIIYGNSLNGVWQFDDFDGIVNNSRIHLNTLSWPEIKNAFFATPQDILGRSMANFSFGLNYYVGGLNVFGYHLVNIVIHLIASIFLYLLVYHTLNLSLLQEKYQKSSYAIALLAAFLWASSPVHVNAVTYIVQRMTSLAGMAYVMSMYFYLKGRTAQDTSRRIALFLLCVVAGGMAICAKQNAVMLPIVIYLYDLFLIQGVSAENIRKNRPIISLILVTAIAGLVYVIFYTSILDYQYWTFSMIERLLTAPRILLFYISLLLYPLGSRLTLDHDIQISRSLIDPWSTLPAILFIICAIGYALWIARRKPLLAFCILFFFLNHLIEGTIIPLDLIFEHRNYVPAMFFFVPVAILMITVLDYFAYKKSLQLLMFFVMTFLLTSQGHTVSVRNDLYHYPEILWKDNINKYPDLSRPRSILGYIYAQRGDYLKAINEHKIAIQVARYPHFRQLALFHFNLASLYFLADDNEEMALSHYRKAMKIHPESISPFVYDGMALILLNRGNLKLADEYSKRATANIPNNAGFHDNYARILLKRGNLEKAIEEALRALSLQPDLIEPLATLGEAYRVKGNYSRSEYYWREFLKKEPNHITALLSSLELYHLREKNEEVQQTVGQLLYLSRAANIFDILKKDKTKNFAYIPDPEKLRPILQNVFLQLTKDSTRPASHR
jgi:tetratricopeptide (TPR) repeat protein